MTRADAPSTHRLGWTLATLAGWMAITFLGAWLFHPGEESLDELVTSGISWQLVAACIFLVAMIRWQGWHDLGFRSPAPGTLRLLWLPLLMVGLLLLLAAAAGLPPISAILFILVNTLVVGFSEETMFRGVLFRTLWGRMSVWPAILVTSVLFGAVHVLNGFITGSFGNAMAQAVLAGCSGILFVAILLRTGSIWVAIVYHALWDTATFLVVAGALTSDEATQASETASVGGVAATLMPLLLVLPNLLYALWLLRKVHKDPPPGAQTL
ncbi:CPBP family intramembrane glutamic endopeptidase [Pelagovum pacificum]|uniref:CPBP family intramembrane metalloprotease n=1 Tax=Pelagovum pacificum TaxID=2588711 RepID=A0A5C5GD32_9RHOB|nr:CPBP family intramembrane glutamic endopeptidase [Pelagovum pacificum]QQA41286.1 CPBP family intramembrane metalloprotease [Pelagovum pacificum]TNY31907.1 CPBP family intramembrane metalloprotease [Pelagovum pacificum]